MPVSTGTDPADIRLVAAPAAPAGSADVTRRWAIAFPDGRERFAGVAPHEGEQVCAALREHDIGDWERLLVEIDLPVVLSDGAGPHLLDADGRMTLALADHPQVPDARVAMGEPSPGHRIGAVRRLPGARVWRWLADAVVAPAHRVEALDALDRADDEAALTRWEARERMRAQVDGPS